MLQFTRFESTNILRYAFDWKQILNSMMHGAKERYLYGFH
jgi:hypothetical protein